MKPTAMDAAKKSHPSNGTTFIHKQVLCSVPTANKGDSMHTNVIQLPLTFRTTDPATSRQAPPRRRRNAQIWTMLEVYTLHDVTDEEAVEIAVGRPATLSDEGLRRRCSDLRALGWIAPTGDERINASGKKRIVCHITNLGLDAWSDHNETL